MKTTSAANPQFLLTSTPTNIISKSLNVFPPNHDRGNNGQRRERNESCRNDLSSILVKVGNANNLTLGSRWFESLVTSISVSVRRLAANHCDKILFSFTVNHCLNDAYVGKQQLVWKEYFAKYSRKTWAAVLDAAT